MSQSELRGRRRRSSLSTGEDRRDGRGNFPLNESRFGAEVGRGRRPSRPSSQPGAERRGGLPARGSTSRFGTSTTETGTPRSQTGGGRLPTGGGWHSKRAFEGRWTSGPPTGDGGLDSYSSSFNLPRHLRGSLRGSDPRSGLCQGPHPRSSPALP